MTRLSRSLGSCENVRVASSERFPVSPEITQAFGYYTCFFYARHPLHSANSAIVQAHLDAMRMVATSQDFSHDSLNLSSCGLVHFQYN